MQRDGEPLCPPGMPPLSVGTSSRPTKQEPEAFHVPEVEGWDGDDDSPGPDAAEHELSPLAASDRFECTRGRNGVSALSMSHGPSSGMPTTMAELEETVRQGSSMIISGTSGLRWIRGEAVGRGSLGTVFQAMDQQNGQMMAVKEVCINSSDATDLKFKDQLENEVQILKELKHPRIVAYLGHDYMDSFLYIYMEFMAGGSLAQVLRNFGCFEESLIVKYTRELLEGLEYLHSRERPVVHRDIKGANVLVDLDCHVKLSDFGCSKRDTDTMSHTMRGSIPWMAPEVIKSTGYGRKADIWSFGCVMIEMATSKSPWGRFDNPMAAMCKIAMSEETPPLPDEVSQACKDFIGICTRRDPAQRLSATELLQHELVKDICTEE